MAEVPESSMVTLEQALRRLRARRLYYALYQHYYDGDHRLAFATEKFRNAFGRIFSRFQLNCCATVVDALADRLEIKEFAVEDSQGNPVEETTDQVSEIWTHNRMERQSNEIHTSALTAGDGYIIVWPNPDDPTQPILYPQPCEQMTIRYDSERPWRALWAAKAWHDEDEDKMRVNIYYPDRIEKYIAKNRNMTNVKATAFRIYEVEGEPWPLPNDYDQVPVFHFTNNAVVGKFGKSELYSVVPIQDALNKTAIDMLVAMEFQALPQRWVAGLEPEIDPTTGKATFPWEPGADRVWFTSDENTKFGQFDAAQIGQFIQAMDAWQLSIARVSGTPLHYFVTLTDPPSGEALKTLEARLIKRAADRQLGFGCTWRDLMQFAVRIRTQQTMSEQKDEIEIKPCWKDPAPRSEKEHAETIETKKRIGISTEQALKELGYTDEEIKTMSEAKQKETVSMAEAALAAFDNGTDGGADAYRPARPRPNLPSARGGG